MKILFRVITFLNGKKAAKNLNDRTNYFKGALKNLNSKNVATSIKI